MTTPGAAEGAVGVSGAGTVDGTGSVGSSVELAAEGDGVAKAMPVISPAVAETLAPNTTHRPPAAA